MGMKARPLPAEDGTWRTKSKNQKATMLTGIEVAAPKTIVIFALDFSHTKKSGCTF